MCCSSFPSVVLRCASVVCRRGELSGAQTVLRPDEEQRRALRIDAHADARVACASNRGGKRGGGKRRLPTRGRLTRADAPDALLHTDPTRCQSAPAVPSLDRTMSAAAAAPAAKAAAAARPAGPSSSSSTPFDAPAVPELEMLLLESLDDAGAAGSIADSQTWLDSIGKGDQHDKLVPVLSSLVSQNYIVINARDHSRMQVSAEGEQYAAAGSPEYQLWSLLPSDLSAVSQKSLEDRLPKGMFQLGVNQCMARKWLAFEGDKKLGMIKRAQAQVTDEAAQGLAKCVAGQIDSVDKALLDTLKKRGLLSTVAWKTYSISRGPSFARVRKLLATDLTMDMLKGDKWKEMDFKEYNFNAAGEELSHGALHPLMKVRAAFRQIFCEMGFEEMNTSNYVESSFWNFDTLFQPQQHPARDAHDTFFIHAPAKTLTLPEEYLKATQQMHQTGGHGSIGYRYDWKREESEKNILRTHTTACSSRMLYQLSQGPFTPRRYFSIDRVRQQQREQAERGEETHAKCTVL